MWASIKKLGGVLIVAGALVPAVLTAVPAAQAAIVCDAGHPCLPQDASFLSTIVSAGAGPTFVCTNAGTSTCLSGQGSSGTTAGVMGYSTGGTGVYGLTNGSTAAGVLGRATNNNQGTGAVWGDNNGTDGAAVGVRGSVAGSGDGGYFTTSASGWGVEARGGYYGVFGIASSTDQPDAAGVSGTITSAAANAAGVRGYNASANCCGMGVAGFHSGQGIGVYGEALNGFGVSGYSPNNWSGYFQGSVNVVGTLTKSAGAFRIDHPLDPAHKYLQHSFVESPDMKNVYDGNVTTNGKGFATVKLPAYFQALNKDFRYQLTIIGRSFAQAIIWKRIAHNQFTIRTNQPSTAVSWQVTGLRHDAYANAHRIRTVVAKEGSAAGKYVHPELYGKPLTKSVVVLPGMDPKTRTKLDAAAAPGKR